MKKAAFKISDYYFDQVSLDLNKKSTAVSDIKFDCNGEFITTEKQYKLVFKVSVFPEDNTTNPFIKIRCNGFFLFEEIDSLEDIPSFFYQNAIALLFPYVRAYISIITTQANRGGLILPTLNLSSLSSTLKSNTIITK